MANIFQFTEKLLLNTEYRKLRRQQKIAYAAFRYTPGTDREANSIREMAKKKYDAVTESINSLKRNAELRKQKAVRRKRLLA